MMVATPCWANVYIKKSMVDNGVTWSFGICTNSQ